MIFILKRKVGNNGPETAQNRAAEKDEQIPTERHRRANRHKRTSNNTIPGWNAIDTPPKPFFDGRFSEVIYVTDGERVEYAVFDSKESVWDVLNGKKLNIIAWKTVNWVQGY